MHDPFPFEDDIGIDMTPLIDIIFMLIVFFVMTTTFSKPVMDIILPSAESSEESSRKSAEMVISIKADGSIVFEEETLTPEQLTALLGTRTEDLLNLHVDEKAPFESFVQIVDQARKLRDGKFVISTRTPGA